MRGKLEIETRGVLGAAPRRSCVAMLADLKKFLVAPYLAESKTSKLGGFFNVFFNETRMEEVFTKTD
eukprot:CAMPEP_0113674030 /NCGR_PEP_ID=MMETSP0038_2-20120614/7185_1 /TAXON_ID=2898 /ORGANISM="Cryptomonas paramecium" /LENGTH=66 /DNA_ID=CAMNT_0000590551 /DNA_START=1114 /DNA_END=1314 /DNA_ORIENTATION=+ /assembly_acc=CAM_ASM_000170